MTALNRSLSQRLLLPWLQIGLLGLLTAGVAQAQLPSIESEDLDESETLAVEVQAPTVERAEIDRLYAEALALFQGEDRPASLTVFGHVTDILNALRTTRGLEPDERDLLVRSLAYRAWVHHELEMTDSVDAAFADILQLDPGRRLANLDSLHPTPPELVKRFDALSKTTVGEVNFVISPLDATVFIDGQAVTDPLRPVAVLAGSRALRVERPGYLPISRDFDVRAGRSASLEIEMERQSAILRLNTRPQEAEIRLDGRVVAVSEGTAAEGFLPQGAAALYRREEFSDEVILDPVESGRRILEVSKPGYRPYRMELVIQELIDYQMPPIVLEEEGGRLVFMDFPRGAKILIDGEETAPDVPGATRPRLTLAPGSYHVTVASGSSKMFSTRLTLADRQNVEVRVELKPGLSFLGVLGADSTAAKNLSQSLLLAARESSKWTWIDRSPEGPDLLAELGVTADALRQGRPIDWRRVQARLDHQAPGLLYLLAVLDNDLVAAEAEFFLLNAGPGPSVPDRVTLPVSNDPALADLRRSLDLNLVLWRPYSGLVAIDSNASAHPIIAHVVPGGPAEAANLKSGDEIVGVDGIPIQSRRELETRFQAAESGESLDLVVRSNGIGSNERMTLGASPRLLRNDEDFLSSVAYADLVLQEETARPAERWILQLNRALLLLAADHNEAAAQLLRSIRGPQISHGLNQGTVDYWLGVALMRSDKPELRSAAIQAFQRAEKLPGARLHDNDGAYLLPRVRARLHQLGRSN